MKRQHGFSLLELLIVCFLVTLLLAIALPNPAVTKRLVQQHQARTRVTQMGVAIAALKTCQAVTPPQDCSAIQALMPAPGVLVMNLGYKYSFFQSAGSPGTQAQSVNCDASPYNYNPTPTGLPWCPSVAPTSQGWSCSFGGNVSGSPWDKCVLAGSPAIPASTSFWAIPASPSDGTFGYVVSDDTIFRCDLSGNLSPSSTDSNVPPCQ